MAETSRSRVTITLGRSGQVVKRAGPALDSGFSDSQPAMGNKRSVRDRLGSDVDGILLNNKRQRGDSSKLTMNCASNVDDMRLGKDDLRFKLMQKNMARRVQSDVDRNGVDLRATLSREVRHSTTSLSMPQQMPDPSGTRRLVPEQRDASLLGRIPSTRSAEALPQMDSLRNTLSPWTLDRLRQRSPHRGLHTNRNISSPRNDEEILKRPLIKSYGDARTVSYVSRRDILESGRPMSSTPYMTKQTVVAAPVKPVVPPLAPPPPQSGIAHKSSYTGDERPTVEGFLRSLGLEKYILSFKAEEVDMTVLRQMGDNDLKELGIPMGPRKKILLALHPKRPLS